MITRERLCEVLHYNRRTGVFTYRVTRGRLTAGQVAGTPDSHGHIQIKIDNRLYLAHRLAWLYVKGIWPRFDLDHEDRIKSNNAFKNLRPATKTQNNINKQMHPRNRSGFKGVGWSEHAGKWRARLSVNRQVLHLGHFDTIEQAVAARAAAVNEHHGAYAGVEQC